MINPESHKTRSSSLGIPEGLPVVSSDLARYWAKVDRRGDDECWLWTASTFRNGYGQFRIQQPGGDGKQQTCLAHRMAWQLSHGPVPAGQSVLHTCDVRRCQNPKHLFLGDHTANMRDAARKGRLSVPRPSRQVITDAQCDDIVALARAGMKQADIAARYGVTKTFVSLLAKGKRRQLRPAAAKRGAA